MGVLCEVGSVTSWNNAGDCVAYVESGLEGFGRYPVFTAVFTGKYRPGKNRFWTPKVEKKREKHNLGLFVAI